MAEDTPPTSPQQQLFNIAVQNPPDWDELIKLIASLQQTKKKGKKKTEGGDGLRECVWSLTEADTKVLWESLADASTDVICRMVEEDEKEPRHCDVKAVEKGAEALRAVLCLASAVLEAEDPAITRGLTRAVMAFHDMMLTLSRRCMDVSVEISGVCERWWTGSLPSKHAIVPNTLTLILQLSYLDMGTQVLVKRLWEMKDAFLLYDLRPPAQQKKKASGRKSESQTVQERIRGLLLHAVTNQIFLKSDPGKKFLSFVFTLDGLMEDIHTAMKAVAFPAATKQGVAEGYGDVYFRTLKLLLDADEKEKVEKFKKCLENLFHSACVWKDHPIVLTNFARAFEQKRNAKQIKHLDTILFRLVQPFIFRYLMVPNNNVRFNTANLFLLLFPYRDYTYNVAQAEELTLRSCNLIMELLKDRCMALRSTTLREMGRICKEYWGHLPVSFMKDFFKLILADHAKDSGCTEARLAVYQALIQIVGNASSHMVMEKIIPDAAKEGINDKNEKVRLTAVKLLLSLRGLRTLKFWNMVGMEDILKRLAVEKSDPVGRAITELLVSSYCPINKGLDERLHRTTTLIRTSYDGARQFYTYVSNFLNMDYSVEQVCLLLRGVYMCVRVATSSSGEESLGELSETDESMEPLPSAHLVPATNHRLMNGLLDCASLLWFSIHDKLQQRKFATLRSKVHKLAGRSFHIFTNFFKNNERIMDSVMCMARLVPPKDIQYISKQVIKRLENITIRQTSGEKMEREHAGLLAAASAWRLPDLVNMVLKWLDDSLNTAEASSPPVKKSKVKFRSVDKGLPKPRQGLLYLLHIVDDKMAQKPLLEEHPDLVVSILERLKTAKEWMGGYLRGDHGKAGLSVITVEDLVYSLRIYYTLKAVAVNKDDTEAWREFLSWMQSECDWMVMDVFPALMEGDPSPPSQDQDVSHSLDERDECSSLLQFCFANPECSNFALQIIKKFLTYVRHLYDVNLMSHELMDQVSALLLRLIQASRVSVHLHADIAEVLQSTANYWLYSEDPSELPDKLYDPLYMAFIQSLILRFRTKPPLPPFERERECGEAIQEMMLSVCVTGPRGIPERATENIIGSTMVSTVSELSAAIQKAECVESPGDADFECPLFPDFVFRFIIQKNEIIVRKLATELEECVSSGSLRQLSFLSTGLESVPPFLSGLGGAAQMLYYLEKAKCPRGLVRAVVLAMQTEMGKEDVTDEEMDSDLYTQTVDLLKSLDAVKPLPGQQQ